MKEFIEAPRKIYAQAKNEGRLVEGLLLEEIKKLALKQQGVVETQFGSIAVDTDPMSRAAPKTENNIDCEFGEEEIKLANQAVEILSKCRIVSLDVPVSVNSGVTTRFLMPEKYAQIAYGLKLLFGELPERVASNPTYHIVFFTDEAFESNKKIKDVREKDVTIRLWMGQKRGEQVKICRNSTYLGEGKKGVFQFEDWRVKAIDREGIFLHAGVRRDFLWIFNGNTQRPELTEKITAIGGLTATGKTTTLCRKLARLPKETFDMIGDDGGVLKHDDSFTVFEPSGLYVKTDGIDKDQPEIFRAATASEAYLENVKLSKYPYMPDFSDTTKTKNGRAIVLRKNLAIGSKDLSARKLDVIILLTRNPLMNAISKLTHEQATMQFIYGESIETSGGIALEDGKFKREFFLDPFVVGNRLEHAMLFYNLLKKNPDVKCFLTNTGTIGEDDIKITLRDTLAIINDVLRDSIKFSDIPDMLGYYFPIKCDRANLDRLVAFEKFKNAELLKIMVKKFLDSRNEYLAEFEKKYGRIDDSIRESLKHEFDEKDFEEILSELNYSVDE